MTGSQDELQYSIKAQSMQQKITFLQPIWDKARTYKTFRWEGKPVEQTSEDKVHHAKQWKHKTITVRNLQHLHELFENLKNKNVIRIAGNPVEPLPEIVERNKETFPSGKIKYIWIDADKWMIPLGCDITTKEGYAEALAIALKERNLGLFLDCDCLVLQSQNAWGDEIRSHLYMELSGDGIDLELMHSWSLAFNKIHGEKILDPQVYVSVQPDYISQRKCIDFDDPLPPDMRLFIIEGMLDSIDSEMLQRSMMRDLREAGMVRKTDTSGGTTIGTPKLGDTWSDTLDYAGTEEHGINAVAFRAAAQLVAAIGFNNVRTKIDYYAKKFHTRLWEAIRANNPDGRRGGREDRDKYDYHKCKSDYIGSVVEKQFGEYIETRVETVNQAIDAILNGEKPSSIYQADILSAMRYIVNQSPVHWADIEDRVKVELKGKVKIMELKKQINAAIKLTSSQLIDKIQDKLSWVRDQHKNLYLKLHNSDNYSLHVMEEMEGRYIEEAMFLMDGQLPPPGFTSQFMKILHSRSQSPKTTPFEDRIIRQRCYTDTTKASPTVYINAGRQANGKQATVVITKNEIKVVHSTDSPITWMDSPKLFPLLMPTRQNIIDKLELSPIDNMADALVEFAIEKLAMYISSYDDDTTADIVAWAVNSFISLKLHKMVQLVGPPKSGKTTAGDFLQDLISPAVPSLQTGNERMSPHTTERDYYQAFRDRYVCFIDNYYSLTQKEQRMFTQMLTGASPTNRILYTRRNETLDMHKPIIITGLGNMVTHSDLADRTITLHFNKRTETERDEEIVQQWVRDKPYILSGILELIRRTLKAHETTDVSPNKRSYWYEVASQVVTGIIDPTKTVEEIKTTRRDHEEQVMVEMVFDNENAPELIAWMMTDEKVNQGFEGTASHLHGMFKNWVEANGGEVFDISGYKASIGFDSCPKQPAEFSKLMNKCAAEIEIATGLSISRSRSMQKRTIKIVLTGQGRCSIVRESNTDID